MPAFYAFVNVEKARKSGLEPDKIYSPYDLWNGLSKDAYRMFRIPERSLERQELESSPEFMELEGNPQYIKKIVASGN